MARETDGAPGRIRTGPTDRPSRRRLLGAIGAGAAGALGGCASMARDWGDEEPAGPDGELDDDRVLRWSYLGNIQEQDPRKLTWFGTGRFPGPAAPTGPRQGFQRPRPLWDLTMALELWGGWLNDFVEVGEPRFGLYDSVDVTPARIAVSIRDDARWSNGDEVLGRDAVPVLLAARLTNNTTPPGEVPPSGPDAPVDAVTGVDWNGKSFTLYSDGEWFDAFAPQRLWTWLTWKGDGWGGVWQHTRIEPYEEWFETIVDLWARAEAGEIDPWDDPVDVYREIEATVATEDDRWERYFHDPDNVVVSGAFRPTAFHDDGDVLLEPNPEFHAADRVGPDAVYVTNVPDREISLSLLKDGDLDYYRGAVRADIAGTFPERVEERVVPAQGGVSLALNHGRPALGQPAVRRALVRAIDTRGVADALHRTRFDPVTVPGGDAHRVRQLLGEDFVADALVGHEHDPEAAADHLRTAGFARDGGEWLAPDGEPFALEVATVGPARTAGRGVRSQLGDFGIDVAGENLQPGEFARARGRGSLDAWVSGLGTGFAAVAVGEVYLRTVARERAARNGYAIFPDDQIEAAPYRDGALEATAADDLEAFELEAPPVGAPDGDRRTWRPPKLGWACRNATDRDTYVSALRQLSWLSNWHLPVLPLAHAGTQHFVAAADYEWPALGRRGVSGVGAGVLQPEDLVALGRTPRPADGDPGTDRTATR